MVSVYHIEWIRSGLWKSVNEMRVATWDVEILYRTGAMIEIVKEMCKIK